jgi:hypothetical protein
MCTNFGQLVVCVLLLFFLSRGTITFMNMSGSALASISLDGHVMMMTAPSANDCLLAPMMIYT